MNPNPDYLAALAGNTYEFRRKNGVFSNMYDAAKRFGESKVFKGSMMA